MRTINKIGIIGKGGSGKDTIADFLRDEFGYTTVAFADGLYQICRDFYKMKKKNRKLLQDVGSAMRTVDEDVFINKALKSLEGKDKVCISDVRALNEYERLKKEGFVFIRVVADLNKRISRIEKRDGIVCDEAYIKSLEEAPIENYLNDVTTDFIVYNNDTIEDLYVLIRNIIADYESF